jgi:hypothetical protein
VRYYLALRMAEKGLVSAPNAAAGLPFQIGGAASGFYSIDTGVGGNSDAASAPRTAPPVPTKGWGE